MRARIDYAKELNPAQLEAATTLEGSVLVVAGAGTGKTRTLVFRVARLVETGVPPASILLLTFTRKASTEMLRRAAMLIDDRCQRVSGGTFHAFANLVLRRHAAAAGLSPSFTIADRGDMEDIVGLVRNELGLAGKEERFPRKETLAEMISGAANRSMPLEEIVRRDFPQFLIQTDKILACAEGYRKHKEKHGVLDYDDLLTRLALLMRDRAEVRESLASRHRFIMVDEYQDTNKVQAEILVLLGSVHKNVLAVGDEAQSIYAFRGARYENIMEFPQAFPGAKVIKLEKNYRSVQPILDVANAILEGASLGYGKRLFSERPSPQRPALVRAPDENAQSRFVVQRILELREEGVPLPEIGVLFRSSFMAYDLEMELAKANIPYVKYGGFKFFEASHIRDALAHVRVLANPDDRISWNRLLLLVDGVGPKLAGVAYESARTGLPLAALKAPPRARQGLARLSALFESLRGVSAPAEMLRRVYDYYEPILKSRFDDYPKRARDLEHLAGLAESYARLDEMLTDMALDPPSKSVRNALAEGTDDEGKLILSTIHSAKGLEWHSVFLLWALDGRFPSFHALDDPEELEEERRLFYVAVTRAKENLYLCYPSFVYDLPSGRILQRPSRFLDEVRPDLFEEVDLVDEDRPDDGGMRYVPLDEE